MSARADKNSKPNGSAVVITQTDVAEQNKPEVIALTEREAQQVQGAIGYIQQVQEENRQREAVAQNQLSAILWQLANIYKVDLNGYEFNVQQNGFVKKA